MITLGRELSECLNAICQLIESMLDDSNAKSSILLLEENQLKHGGAPSLPKAYCEAIDGVVIGPSVGSCGTAAFRDSQVFVDDIEHDPLWANFKHVALEHGLKACWSNPIHSPQGTVLGTFAIYYLEPKAPEAHHLELIDRFTSLSSLAIEKSKASARETLLTTKLRYSNEKFSAFTSVMPDLALIIDDKGTYIDIYGADESILYSSSKSLLGKNIGDVLPTKSANEVMGVINNTFKSGEVQVFEYELPVQKGICTFEGRVTAIDHYLPEEPDTKHVLWMARDITDRKNAERQIEKLAFYDPLTELPNRRLLMERLQLLVGRAKRNKQMSALLYLDLDDFKRINDSLGHSVGDLLLIDVANRLKTILRKSDILARIGGDEFVIILETLEDSIEDICDDASNVALKVIEKFADSYRIDASEYQIGVSIGISIIDSEQSTTDESLKRADTAMYRSKKSGGNQFCFFDPELQRSLDLRMELEQSLVKAIELGQFFTYFQPQVNFDRKVVGAEALIRWHHPEKGMVPPLEFISVAEQLGLINQLQKIVLKQSLELIVSLDKKKLLHDGFSVAVNMSAIQFKNPYLKSELTATCKEFNINPRCIKLEITESMLIDDVEHTVKQMNELKAEGFRFSIDDFGTGYSSLAYLHKFPIDELKIDKSFIDNVHKDKASLGIIDAIIALSRYLGVTVIAEGIEVEGQLKKMSESNIEAMQGYYFARPMPSDAFMNWLLNN